MTRHAKNNTAGAFYTYHERKRDTAQSGYGTHKQRANKDYVKPFDCCSLTMQPCRHPVVTIDGDLFDKEAILQYIITKKNEYNRKLKEYERIKRNENASEKQPQPPGKPVKVALPTNSNGSVSNMANGNDKKLSNFWLPSQIPTVSIGKAVKPDPNIYCPVSNKPLKVKNLIEVKFTFVKTDNGEKQYKCPVTHDIINNAVPCAVLRPTGDVVTMECVEKLIKTNWIHPLTNQNLTERDIIPLQRGGTGYSKTNKNLELVDRRPVMQC